MVVVMNGCWWLRILRKGIGLRGKKRSEDRKAGRKGSNRSMTTQRFKVEEFQKPQWRRSVATYMVHILQ
jgi:hypothetical protein